MLQLIVEGLIDTPEECKITAIDSGDTTIFHVAVASTDIGKVIGKAGRTARSIRTILAAASSRDKARYVLDIQEAA
jgi:hypothetical protein